MNTTKYDAPAVGSNQEVAELVVRYLLMVQAKRDRHSHVISWNKTKIVQHFLSLGIDKALGHVNVKWVKARNKNVLTKYIVDEEFNSEEIEEKLDNLGIDPDRLYQLSSFLPSRKRVM